MQNPLLTRFLTLGANGMAGFMDFGVGVFIVAMLGSIFSLDITFYHLLVGGIFALFPDFDIVPKILKGEEPDSNHHLTLFHRPLLIIPLLTVLAFLFAGPNWALIVFMCVFWHFLHDTKWFSELGGIAWFWPITDRYWSPLHGFEVPKENTPHHLYLQKYWLVPSTLSLYEFTVGVLTLYSACYLGGFVFLGAALSCAAASAFLAVWLLYPKTAVQHVHDFPYS